MKLEKPKLTGKTDRENLHILETWADNLVDSLNYEVNHIDDSNLVEGKLITREEVEEIMQKNYQELRELIVNRTKGG